MKKEFLDLVGYEGNIIELSNVLQGLGCEDICWFDNMEEILDSNNMVVATDKYGENNIQITFSVTIKNSNDECAETSHIKISKIEEF